MASAVENEAGDATGRREGEKEEEEEEEEQPLHFHVPYIHNGYILDYLAKQGNKHTANMLFELPLCRHKDQGTMASCLTRLKDRRRKLLKRRSLSVEDEDNLQKFLDAEFAFPAPSATPRF